jgi:hypothetical protein
MEALGISNFHDHMSSDGNPNKLIGKYMTATKGTPCIFRHCIQSCAFLVEKLVVF